MLKATKLCGSIVAVICALSLFANTSQRTAFGAADLDSTARLTVADLVEGAKKEGKLTFYSALPQFSNQLLLKAFMTTYPFVKAEVVRAGGPVIAQRFSAEKARNVENMDVIYSGAAEAYPEWVKSDYIARIDNLPEWPDVIDLAKAPSNRYVAFAYALQVLAWNRKMVQDDEVPSDLWEFTKPMWKGGVATGDPVGAGFALNWYSFAAGDRPQDPRSHGRPPGLGWPWMSAMSQNEVLLAGQLGNLTDTLVSGRRPVVLQHWDTEIVEAIKQGAQLGWKYPKQGTVAQHILGAVNSKAPHPYTARLFLNWLLSQEGQTLLVKEVAMNIVRKDMRTADFLPGRMQIVDAWIMDIEKITSDDTRAFVTKVGQTMRGR